MRGEHIPFDEVPLEKDQKDLLADMVEAERAVSAQDREEFFLIGTSAGYFMHHPGLKREAVYPGDLRELAQWGLLRLGYTTRGDEKFDVTGNGRLFYAWMKQQQGEPVEQVEAEVRHFLDSEAFRKRHPIAYERWAAAQSEVWSAETVAEFTDIGHACRDAIQQLVTDLVAKHKPPDIEPNPQNTVARLKAVLAKVDLPDTVEKFAAALLPYFGTVSDLVQRQEHGAQKEGEDLTWEDARRVVFQTALVMFELDRGLG